LEETGILSSLSRLIQKIDETGCLDRKVGSGQPRTVRTADSIAVVGEMICSQEDKPGNHGGHVEPFFD